MNIFLLIYLIGAIFSLLIQVYVTRWGSLFETIFRDFKYAYCFRQYLHASISLLISVFIITMAIIILTGLSWIMVIIYLVTFIKEKK